MKSEDIAKLAGVSRSTVSRVINNYSNVPEKTRKKVEEIIEKYEYIPNNSARNLVGKSNKIIGVFILDFYMSEDNYTIRSSPFFSDFIIYAADKSQSLGYNILISVINNKKNIKEIEYMFKNKTISGAIIMGDEIERGEVEKFANKDYKIALINQLNEPFNENVILINTSNKKGSYIATKVLIENGHKKIGHITGDFNKLSVKERFDGFIMKLNEENINVNQDYIGYGRIHREKSGYKAMKNILETNGDNYPTAIFAESDLMAIGAIRAIKEFGLRVPEDISIIGYDNIEMSKYSDPALSTISVSTKDASDIAISKLINLIEQKEHESNSCYQVKVQLVERESVRCIK